MVSYKRNCGKKLFEAELLQDVGLFFTHRQHVMTCDAVLGNGLSGIVLVIIVVASEAAGELVMTEVVGIRAPRNHHLREDIASINAFHGGWSLVQWFLSRQRKNGVTLDERSRSIELARLERCIHSGSRHFECVRRTIVAIHAIHPAAFARRIRRLVYDSITGDPRDILTIRIGGDVLDVLPDMRLVDLRPEMQHQNRNLFGVVFIFLVTANDL